MEPPTPKSQQVKVFLKLRPLPHDIRAISMVRKRSVREIVVKLKVGERKYQFDRVFENQASSHSEVYEGAIAPMIDSMVAGYDCTVISYGQESGDGIITCASELDVNRPSEISPSDGMILRAASHLFTTLEQQNKKDSAVQVSFIEIVNDDLRDLFATPENQNPVRIYNNPDHRGSVSIKGASKIFVTTVQEVHKLLKTGLEARKSPSSIVIFTFALYMRDLSLESEDVITYATLNLVDMAGLQNKTRDGATNKSLLTFGKVVTALAQKSQHVPFKDSKLTRFLQDSLGGNSMTCLIATVLPVMSEDCVLILDYAFEARHITNYPDANLKRRPINILQDLTLENASLKRELEAARTGTGFFVTADMFDQWKHDSKSAKQLEAKLQELDLTNDQLKRATERGDCLERLTQQMSAECDRQVDDLKSVVNELTLECSNRHVSEQEFRQKYQEQVKINSNLVEKNKEMHVLLRGMGDQSIRYNEDVNKTFKMIVKETNDQADLINRTLSDLKGDLDKLKSASTVRNVQDLLGPFDSFADQLSSAFDEIMSKVNDNSEDEPLNDLRSQLKQTAAHSLSQHEATDHLLKSIVEGCGDLKNIVVQLDAFQGKLHSNYDNFETSYVALREEINEGANANMSDMEISSRQYHDGTVASLDRIVSLINDCKSKVCDSRDLSESIADKITASLNIIGSFASEHRTSCIDLMELRRNGLDDRHADLRKRTEVLSVNLDKVVAEHLKLEPIAMNLDKSRQTFVECFDNTYKGAEIVVKQLEESVEKKVSMGDTPQKENYVYPRSIPDLPTMIDLGVSDGQSESA